MKSNYDQARKAMRARYEWLPVMTGGGICLCKS